MALERGTVKVFNLGFSFEPTIPVLFLGFTPEIYFQFINKDFYEYVLQNCWRIVFNLSTGNGYLMNQEAIDQFETAYNEFYIW